MKHRICDDGQGHTLYMQGKKLIVFGESGNQIHDKKVYKNLLNIQNESKTKTTEE